MSCMNKYSIDRTAVRTEPPRPPLPSSCRRATCRPTHETAAGVGARRRAAAACRKSAEIDLVRHFVNLSHAEHVDRHEFLSARLVHDEVQPEAARTARRHCPASPTCIRSRPTNRCQGMLEMLCEMQNILAEIAGLDAVLAAAGRRRPGRIDRPARRRRLLPRHGRDSARASSSPTAPTAPTRPAPPSPASRPSPSRATPAASSISTTCSAKLDERHRRVHDHQSEHARPVREPDRDDHRTCCTSTAAWSISTAPT